jgi:hypothetical protein
MEYVFVVVFEPESATRTVKLEVVAVVGVPVIAPAVLSDSPAGRLPDETVQVYDPEPPEADSEFE